VSIAWYAVAILLGGVGASARVWLTQAGETRLPGGAPMATGIINVVGAGLLGGVAALVVDPALFVVGYGLLGGLTTFSTWMVEVDEEQRLGRFGMAALTLGLPTLLGAGAYALTRALL
jgi:CrcB protein